MPAIPATPRALAHFASHVSDARRRSEVMQTGAELALFIEHRGPDQLLCAVYVKGDEVRRTGMVITHDNNNPTAVLIAIREIVNHALVDIAGGRISPAASV